MAAGGGVVEEASEGHEGEAGEMSRRRKPKTTTDQTPRQDLVAPSIATVQAR